MKTVGEILQLVGAYLAEKGIERPKREAEELVADQLCCKRIDLFLQFDRPLSEEELSSCRAALKERANHTPLAYISGKVEFFGLILEVNSSVLIPRPETELLVEMIVKERPTGRLLDLCCGSGAIGLALKHHLPHLEVTLADISQSAVEVAQKNKEQLALNVTIVQSDLLSHLNQSFDVIVCNPPYISEQDYPSLSQEVRKEPKQALVGGSTGYEYYEKLADILDCKRVFFEIGSGMGERIKSLFEKKGYAVELTPDYAGHDRYLSLRR